MNNQAPYGFFPGNQGGFIPNQPNNQQCNCSSQIRSINNQINNLERQINRLERRVRRLEFSNNAPTPYNTNLTNNEYPNAYDQDNYII